MYKINKSNDIKLTKCYALCQMELLYISLKIIDNAISHDCKENNLSRYVRNQ